MNLLITFSLLNIANVIIQTVKSLVTIKCGKTVAALVNAIAYGLYTVVLVYTMADLPLMLKAVIVASCNFIGVFIVKWGEEKARKDKLWKIEATFDTPQAKAVKDCLEIAHIPYNYIDIEKYHIFNIYCATQSESIKAKKILDTYDAKYFVTESKAL